MDGHLSPSQLPPVLAGKQLVQVGILPFTSQSVSRPVSQPSSSTGNESPASQSSGNHGSSQSSAESAFIRPDCERISDQPTSRMASPRPLLKLTNVRVDAKPSVGPGHGGRTTNPVRFSFVDEWFAHPGGSQPGKPEHAQLPLIRRGVALSRFMKLQ
jgi:hypothetical protein